MKRNQLIKILQVALFATFFFIAGFYFADWKVNSLLGKIDRILMMEVKQFIVLLFLLELISLGLVSAFLKKEPT